MDERPEPGESPQEYWAPDLGMRDAKVSGRLWPPDFAASRSDEGYIVHLHWAVVEGRFEVVQINVRTAHREYPPGAGRGTHPGKIVHGHRPLGAANLRTIPLGTIIDEDRRIMMSRMAAMLRPGYEGPLPGGRAGQEEQLRQLAGRRHRYSLDYYRRVADLYDEALRFGDRHPTAHAAQTLGGPRSTIAKHVMTARKLGLLPPTQPRQARGNTEAT